MFERISSLAFLMLIAAFASPAHAGTAMYQASFVMDAFGNDVTTGTTWPSNTSYFVEMPFGGPAAGAGTINVTPTGTGPAPIALPQSAFTVSTAAFWPIYPTTFYYTYAKFANQAGTFQAGGGPAAGKGTVHHPGNGNRVGEWFIREGPNAFGGALGLLGEQGAYAHFQIKTSGPSVPLPGTFTGTSEWNMIHALGRTGMDSLNPYTNTGMFVQTSTGALTRYTKFASGTPWTTGSVTVYATVGSFTTVLHRQGYDTTTPGGIRNIQLVTPSLTHWKRDHGRPFNHTGHIGILKLQLVPEPNSVLMLAVGTGALLLLHRRYRQAC